jgi:hypothetical protein
MYFLTGALCTTNALAKFLCNLSLAFNGNNNSNNNFNSNNIENKNNCIKYETAKFMLADENLKDFGFYFYYYYYFI